MASALASEYPWVSSPVVINAPMRGFAGPDLVIAVTRAKGLAFLATVPNDNTNTSNLEQISLALTGQKRPATNETLPIGVGVLLFAQKLDKYAQLVEDFRPAAAWLFAAHSSQDYQTWITKIREVSPKTKIWIQCSSIAVALELAKLCKPDVLVMQGIDAGGHGSEKGASIVSLLPETSDALENEDLGHIHLVAAGGIVDGRGAAAALSLGAKAVVLGTRFLAAHETAIHPEYQRAVLETKDGGQNTVRAKVFDELSGPNIWPVTYDGRAIVAASYHDHVSGMSIEEIRKLHAEAKRHEAAGFALDNRRAAIWAGTAVGGVSQVQSATEIIQEVRDGATRALNRAKAHL